MEIKTPIWMWDDRWGHRHVVTGQITSHDCREVYKYTYVSTRPVRGTVGAWQPACLLGRAIAEVVDADMS